MSADGMVKAAKDPCYRFENVQIDVQNLRVTVGSEIRPLEPKSFRLLLFLVENPGRAIPKDEIMAAVWPDAIVSDNSLARAITQIRKALDDDPRAPRYVETVPTIGYRFIADCSQTPEATSPARPLAASAGPSPKRLAPLLAVVGACLLLAAGAWLWHIRAYRQPATPGPLTVVGVTRLTSYPGDERDPSMSPDGSYIAFSWSGDSGDNYDIYVIKAGGQQPLRLTHDPAPETFPAWSPDGSQIAFVRRKGQSAEIVVVPALGGPERILHQFARIGADLDFTQHPVLGWSQDGSSIVYSGQSSAGEKYRLFLLSLETGTVRTLSTPGADSVGDSSPALSADGKSLAFVRYLAPRNGQMLLQTLAPGFVPTGDPVPIKTSALALRSPLWLQDGAQLLFADATQIFQWDRNHGTNLIYSADGLLGGMALGPPRPGRNRQLVVALEKQDADIWVTPLNPQGTKATGPPAQLIRSTASDNHPEYSPDGRHIVFVSARSGTAEIWVADADGTNLRQLTHLGAHIVSYPSWSPDGSRIAFHARVPDVAQVYVVGLDQGVARQITHANPGLALATWSGDESYLYASTLAGGRSMAYRIPIAGGPAEPLWEGDLLLESTDRKYVLYWKSSTPGIYRRPLQPDLAHSPEQLLIPDFWPTQQLGGYAPVAGGVYYVSLDRRGQPGPFRFFDYAKQTSIDIAPAVPGLNRGITVSPDRRHMVFAAGTEIGGDLVQLELK